MTNETNRRAALGVVLAAGAIAATALPAAGRVLAHAEPDPSLARLAKVRAIWDRIGEILKANAEDEAAITEAWRVFDAAEAEFLETPPTTLAGARAAIAWLIEYDRPNIPETSGEYLLTLIRSPIFAQEEAAS